MPTPHSIDGKLLAGLELRRMPVAQFSIVAGFEGIRNASTTKLNEAFRDVDPLPNETAARLWALWLEIDELARSVEPLTLDLRNGKLVHEWLVKHRQGELIGTQDVVVVVVPSED